MPKMICPEHKCRLLANDTRYGTRYACPRGNCTVVCWAGSTSTPADEHTRFARTMAHNAFDELWKCQHFTRSQAYKKLAKFLGLKIKDTHIGHFDMETAIKVQRFAKELVRQGRT